MTAIRLPLLPLAIVVIVAALPGCSAGVLTRGATHAPSPSSGETADPTASATDRCDAEQLTVRRETSVEGTESGPGSRTLEYTFTNTSAAACTLLGYPSFALLDANGEPLEDQRFGEADGRHAGTEEMLHEVTLAPNGEATFHVTIGGAVVEACQASSHVAISAPDDEHVFTLPERIQNCGGLIEVSPLHRE